MTLCRKIFIIVAAILFTAFGTTYAKVILSIPGEIILIEGEEYYYSIGSLLPISVITNKDTLFELHCRAPKTQSSCPGFHRVFLLKSEKGGKTRIGFKLFGILPVKSVNVNIVPNRQLVVCGNTIGVRLDLDGILVIGISYVDIDGNKQMPVKNSGIRPGCVIKEINGKKVESISEFVKEIDKSDGKPVRISFRSDGSNVETDVTPVISSKDKKYRVGLWVRDSSAGIGTLTFYDGISREYGALGHGITDIDTGTLMPVKTGEILESSILGVKTGKSGEPGELKGFFTDGARLGIIASNSETGIYGRLDASAPDRISGRICSVGVRADISEGPATILSNINGKKTDEYSIIIQKVSRTNTTSNKSMIIKVIDKKLLEITGGIVQGMSGSPIIQNGKIVGAVTHVLVNDPTRGYGTFIETMLKQEI